MAETRLINSVGQISIPVSDVGRAVEFCRGVLELRPVYDSADGETALFDGARQFTSVEASWQLKSYKPIRSPI